MGSRYWAVKSKFTVNGIFVSACVYGCCYEEKPYNKSYSDTSGTVTFNWFETVEEAAAAAYLYNVKEGGRKWRQGF